MQNTTSATITLNCNKEISYLNIRDGKFISFATIAGLNGEKQTHPPKTYNKNKFKKW